MCPRQACGLCSKMLNVSALWWMPTGLLAERPSQSSFDIGMEAHVCGRSALIPLSWPIDSGRQAADAHTTASLLCAPRLRPIGHSWCSLSCPRLGPARARGQPKRPRGKTPVPVASLAQCLALIPRPAPSLRARRWTDRGHRPHQATPRRCGPVLGSSQLATALQALP